MRPDAPVADLIGMSRGSRAAIFKAMRGVRSTAEDARALFLDGAGHLKPEAGRLLGRLAKEAQLNVLAFEPDARRQDYRLGQQHMVRFLARMLELDVARLNHLQSELEKTA